MWHAIQKRSAGWCANSASACQRSSACARGGGQHPQPAVTKQRGAPPRELVALANAKCIAWAALSESSDFWQDFKGQVRNADRFAKDIGKRMASLTNDTPEWHAHKVVHKKSHVVSTVLAAYYKSGGYSSHLVKTMDQGDHYLQLPPFVVTDFKHPAFVLCQRHEARCLGSSGRASWQSVTTSTLVRIGFGPDAEDILKFQRGLIGQQITQMGSEADFAVVMKSYRAFFDVAERVDFVCCETLAVDIKYAHAIVTFAECDSTEGAEVLRQALNGTQDAKNTVLHAFTQCMNGVA